MKIQLKQMAPHLTLVTIDGTDLFFSYETLVAFQVGNTGRGAVIQNQWGPTTGKHLNKIDGGGETARHSRLSAEDFAKACANLHLTTEGGRS